jgi:hypothetical protein
MEVIALVVVIALQLFHSIYTTYQSRKYEQTLIDKIVSPTPVIYQPVGGTNTEIDYDKPSVQEMLERLSSKEEGIPVV